MLKTLFRLNINHNDRRCRIRYPQRMTKPKSLVAVAGVLAAMVLLSGCRREPFTLVKASGRITYEDGTLIPAEGNYVRLTFYPQTPPRDPKTHPRPGVAEVNLADGTFSCVTSHKYGDGLTAGKHKVVVSTDVLQQVPKGVPPEYNALTTTPLEADTANLPILLRIKKP